jgi:hypothetical protein
MAMTPAALASRVAAFDAAAWLDTMTAAWPTEDLAGDDEDEDDEELVYANG